MGTAEERHPTVDHLRAGEPIYGSPETTACSRGVGLQRMLRRVVTELAAETSARASSQNSRIRLNCFGSLPTLSKTSAPSRFPSRGVQKNRLFPRTEKSGLPGFYPNQLSLVPGGSGHSILCPYVGKLDCSKYAR